MVAMATAGTLSFEAGPGLGGVTALWTEGLVQSHDIQNRGLHCENQISGKYAPGPSSVLILSPPVIVTVIVIVNSTSNLKHQLPLQKYVPLMWSLF